MSDLEPCSRCRLLFAPLALTNGRCLSCHKEIEYLKNFAYLDGRRLAPSHRWLARRARLVGQKKKKGSDP